MDSGFAIGIRANYRDAHRINRLKLPAPERESAPLGLPAQAEPAPSDVSAAFWLPPAREPLGVMAVGPLPRPAPDAAPGPVPVS
jgi:hypothetical protein